MLEINDFLVKRLLIIQFEEYTQPCNRFLKINII